MLAASKTILTVIRWVVGLLFVFSGLVKANDPLGLSYKMQEFFEAWGINGLHQYTLALSVLMNAFEIIAGVAVIIGWRMKLFAWLLLLLIIFFTFLTGYASLAKNADGSLKFRSCGCFGDCIPLNPDQSFLKDIVLLVLIGVIFYYRNKIQPLFSKNAVNLFVIAGAVIFSFAFQWFSLKYLPVVDCLPFKPGANIIEGRKMPPDGIPDKYEMKFVYEKAGNKQEFDVGNLPDSTWKFVERKQVLIKKGKNNEPKIKDFNLQTADGADLTEDILNRPGNYYLLFIQHSNGLDKNNAWIKQAAAIAAKNPLVIVTSAPDQVKLLIADNGVLNQSALMVCDVTAIKTAARAVPTLYKMNGPVVVNKWSYANFGKVN
jgi:uncharacterized membrane protein YphA (DoxX/SURF4 family)